MAPPGVEDNNWSKRTASLVKLQHNIWAWEEKSWGRRVSGREGDADLEALSLDLEFEQPVWTLLPCRNCSRYQDNNTMPVLMETLPAQGLGFFFDKKCSPLALRSPGWRMQLT